VDKVVSGKYADIEKKKKKVIAVYDSKISIIQKVNTIYLSFNTILILNNCLLIPFSYYVSVF
jgi:hypothetical protein